METNKCYSADRERFYEDFQTAYEELCEGNVMYEGDAVTPCASDFVPDADWVLEWMGDNAYDNLGECAEDWPIVSKEAKDELEAFLNDWAVRNCPVTFYRVENVREMVVED